MKITKHNKGDGQNNFSAEIILRIKKGNLDKVAKIWTGTKVGVGGGWVFAEIRERTTFVIVCPDQIQRKSTFEK